MTNRSLKSTLWLAAGIPAALLLVVPGIVPPIEFDSIRLVKNGSAWGLIVALATLAPFATALVMSSGGRNPRQLAVARGIAFGGALTAVVVLGVTIPLTLYAALFGAGALLGLRLVSIIALICINAMLAWRARPDSSVTAAFVLALGATVAYAALVVSAGSAAAALARRDARAYRQRMENSARAAESAVRSAMLCAIRFRGRDSTKAVPNDLPSLIRDAGCDAQLADPQATPDYALDFTPITADPPQTGTAAGSNAGCLVTARFTGHRLRLDQGGRYDDGRTITGGCAGVLRKRERHREDSTDPDMVVGFSPSTLVRSLSFDLGKFAGEPNAHAYPATLAEFRNRSVADRRGLAPLAFLPEQSPADLDTNVIRMPQYVVRYIPERTDAGPHGTIVGFSLDVRCAAYGGECLRSYLLDSDGLIHGTGQNRAATTLDPVIEDCELEANQAFCDGTPAPTIPRSPRRQE